MNERRNEKKYNNICRHTVKWTIKVRDEIHRRTIRYNTFAFSLVERDILIWTEESSETLNDKSDKVDISVILTNRTIVKGSSWRHSFVLKKKTISSFSLKMASSSSASLAQFKCFSCNAIPTEEQVNKCSRGHTNCLKCSSKNTQCTVWIYFKVIFYKINWIFFVNFLLFPAVSFGFGENSQPSIDNSENNDKNGMHVQR